MLTLDCAVQANQHRSVIGDKVIHILDIPDDYRYMDPELVEQLQTSVGEILELL